MFYFFSTEKQIWRHHNNDAERKKDQEKREKEKAQRANIGENCHRKRKKANRATSLHIYVTEKESG